MLRWHNGRQIQLPSQNRHTVCILPFAARVTRAQNRHTVRHTCRQRERVLAFQEASEAFLVGLFEDRPTSSASEVSWKARMTPSPLPFLHFCKCRGLAGGVQHNEALNYEVHVGGALLHVKRAARMHVERAARMHVESAREYKSVSYEKKKNRKAALLKLFFFFNPDGLKAEFL